MREIGEVRFRFTGDETQCQRYIALARTLLGLLKRASPVPFASRILQLQDGVTIRLTVNSGFSTIEIDVPETVQTQEITQGVATIPALLGIGWAQQLNDSFNLAHTGVLASTFDRMAGILVTGDIALAGWTLGNVNFLDCDTDLFDGAVLVDAVAGNTPGVLSLKHYKSGIYFTFSATTSAAGAPSVFPSRDGKVIITATPTVESASLMLYDIHQHTLTSVAQPDGTVRVAVSTLYVGSISALDQAAQFIFPAPAFDREMTHAVWWQYQSDFTAGSSGVVGETTLTAFSMAIPSGAGATYEVEVLNEEEQTTDATIYASDPAKFAQTLADIPGAAVRPLNDAAPSWVKRTARRVFYWDGLDNGYFANDMVLGCKVVLWSRDAIMRGTTEVYAPVDDNFAHVISQITWGLNTSEDIAAFLYKKVPLIQDIAADFLPDNPGIHDPPHAVTFNGDIVYRQDINGALTYKLLIVEGTALTYSASASSSADVRAHATGRALIVTGDGPTYILEKIAGLWVKKAIALPAVVNGVFPAAFNSDTQYVSLPLKSDGTFGFQLYAFATPAPGSPSVDVYTTQTQKKPDGSWAYTETRIGSTLLVPQPGKLAVSNFRAFGALRPFLS